MCLESALENDQGLWSQLKKKQILDRQTLIFKQMKDDHMTAFGMKKIKCLQASAPEVVCSGRSDRYLQLEPESEKRFSIGFCCK